MSRHRNFRNRDFSEDLDDFDDDQYGKSFEDKFSVSPGTAEHYLLNYKVKNSDYDSDRNSPKEDASELTISSEADKKITYAQLSSAIDYVNDVLNNSKSRNEIIDALKKYDNDVEKAVDLLLNSRDSHSDSKPIQIRSGATNNDCKDEKKIEVEITKRQPSQAASQKLNTEKNLEGQESPLAKSTKKNTSKSLEEIKEVYKQQRLTNKLHLNLIIAGHVDAGKSTIIGHLLSLLGNVSQKIMHKNENEAKKAGKASFMYAWILDVTEEERKRGVTIDVGQYRFETEKRIVNVLDAPGHRDFIPNMITGATKADFALLVIDATSGEFESGFESGGQTQEHILLLRSLGVHQIVIVINKMDNVNYSLERFNDIVLKLKKFLKQVGFKEESIQTVPCSGIHGDNLVKHSDIAAFKWFKGSTLINVIDNFQALPRQIDKPFRMSVSDCYRGQTTGIFVSGKIDYGYVEINRKLLIMPKNEFCIVKNILIEDETRTEAFAGDVVSLNVQLLDGSEIFIGNVLCDISCPCKVSDKFEARVVTFGTLEVPLLKGSSILLYSVCMMSEMAFITKLCSQVDKTRNEIIKKNPRLIDKNKAAIIRIKTERPVCLETFENSKEFGRFVFRSEHQTLGTGIVEKIL
ncbi:ufm1-specific protease 2-like [Sarcoptes scabiei]|nr:ufm1-specific protease 2-like [Sarcoptes scabiei]